MTLLQRIRILPLLVIVALLSFAVRMGEVASGLGGSGTAFAQQQVNEPVPPLPGQEEMAAETAEAAPAPETGGNTREWRDASETDYEYSEVRAELFRDLSKRRQAIEEQEKALTAREALLLAAERELDAKVRELTILRAEIEGLLTQQTEEEKARIASLVTIYEGMKAKDAARIFNTLDMDVLLEVMGQMSERKTAPILAEMNSERARAVTVLLAQRNKLPELPMP